MNGHSEVKYSPFLGKGKVGLSDNVSVHEADTCFKNVAKVIWLCFYTSVKVPGKESLSHCFTH